MKSRLLRAMLLGGCAAAGMVAGPQVLAQEQPSSTIAPPAGEASSGGLEDIVVTARRRSENLQTTPVSITAVTSQTLEQRTVLSLSDLSRLAPSFKVEQVPGGVGSAGGAVRGIFYAENTPGQDPPSSIYVDGVVFGRLSVAVMDLVQPDRVEVLRGPQGTLFGRNTTAGAIQVVSHTPTDTFS